MIGPEPFVCKDVLSCLVERNEKTEVEYSHRKPGYWQVYVRCSPNVASTTMCLSRRQTTSCESYKNTMIIAVKTITQHQPASQCS